MAIFIFQKSLETLSDPGSSAISAATRMSQDCLRWRECKWLVPSINPGQKRVRSPSVTKAPLGNAVEWPCSYTSIYTHSRLASNFSVFAPAVSLRDGHPAAFPLPHSLFMHHSNGFPPPQRSPPSPLERPAHLCISRAHRLGLNGSQYFNVYMLSPLNSMYTWQRDSLISPIFTEHL